MHVIGITNFMELRMVLSLGTNLTEVRPRLVIGESTPGLDAQTSTCWSIRPSIAVGNTNETVHHRLWPGLFPPLLDVDRPLYDSGSGLSCLQVPPAEESTLVWLSPCTKYYVVQRPRTRTAGDSYESVPVACRRYSTYIVLPQRPSTVAAPRSDIASMSRHKHVRPPSLRKACFVHVRRHFCICPALLRPWSWILLLPYLTWYAGHAAIEHQRCNIIGQASQTYI
ncbi:hypothetical protein J3F83DRAFT_33864 [Trichoderma novae-zelandiae]